MPAFGLHPPSMKPCLAENPPPPPPPISSIASEYPALSYVFYPPFGEYEAHSQSEPGHDPQQQYSYDDYESFHPWQTSDAACANRANGLDFTGFSSHTEWPSLSHGACGATSSTHLWGSPWQAQHGAFSDSTSPWIRPSLYDQSCPPVYFPAADSSPYLCRTAWPLHGTSTMTIPTLPYTPGAYTPYTPPATGNFAEEGGWNFNLNSSENVAPRAHTGNYRQVMVSYLGETNSEVDEEVARSHGVVSWEENGRILKGEEHKIDQEHSSLMYSSLTCTLTEPSHKQNAVNLTEDGQLQVHKDTRTQMSCILNLEEGCQGGGATLVNTSSHCSSVPTSHEAKPVSLKIDQGTIDTSGVNPSNVPCIDEGAATADTGLTKPQHLGAQTADSSLRGDEQKIHSKPFVNKGPDAENAKSSHEDITCTANDQSSGDLHSSRGCESLISSIHYLSTVLTDSLRTDKAKDNIDVNTLETSICLLSYCLLKRSSGNLTKTSFDPLMKSQQIIQEQSPKVSAGLMAAVSIPVKKQLEELVKESLELQGKLSKLQAYISHELRESNAAVCQYKSMLREAQDALSYSRSEIRKTEAELEGLKLSLSKFKDAGDFRDFLEHGSSDCKGGLDLNSLPSSSHATEEQQKVTCRFDQDACSSISISSPVCSSNFDKGFTHCLSLTLARGVSDLDLSGMDNSRSTEGLMATDMTSHIVQNLESGRPSAKSEQEVFLEVYPLPLTSTPERVEEGSVNVLNRESNTCLGGESECPSDAENCVTCFEADAEWEYVPVPRAYV